MRFAAAEAVNCHPMLSLTAPCVAVRTLVARPVMAVLSDLGEVAKPFVVMDHCIFFPG